MSEKTQTETIAGKLPPQNLDAEKSLIGAILIDEEVLADASEISSRSRPRSYSASDSTTDRKSVV